MYTLISKMIFLEEIRTKITQGLYGNLFIILTTTLYQNNASN